MLKDVLKAARMRKNLKQEEVAKAVNVTKQTYLKWENGATEPKASQILELSKMLNITPNEICKGRMNTKYTLDKFVLEIHRHGVSANIQTLKSWEHIPDHDDFFKEIKMLGDDEEFLDRHAQEIDENAKEKAMFEEECEIGKK